MNRTPPADGFFQGTREYGNPMRKAISKKLRFDVFKRDGFVCAYCGTTPPSVVLQVDHINPVANGGSNDIDNLITSCQPCNIGKGAITLESIPQSLSEKAKMIKEQEAQIEAYYEILQDRKDRIDDEMWRIADIIDPGSPETGMNRDWLKSIKYFLENLDFFQVEEASQIARCKYKYGGKKAFLYFCGVCHNKIRGE